MVDSIQEFISRIRGNNRLYTYSEDATKQAIILPLLQILGWDIFDVEEVVPEKGVGSGRVDYALRMGDASKVFIEAKRCSEDLDKPRWQEQLLKYAFQEGVKLAILTNGLIWWFYLPLREGDWEQRKFYSIDLTQQSPEDIATRFIDFLSRENLISGKAIKKAEDIISGIKRARVVRSTLPKAWENLISEPDELLIELLKDKVENLCGFSPTKEELISYLISIGRKEPASHKPKPQVSPTTKDVSPPRQQGVFIPKMDEEFVTWMQENSDGYFLNVKRDFGPSLMVLHRSGCLHYKGHYKPGAFTQRQYRKVCSNDLNKLEKWVESRGGTFTKVCNSCRGGK